MRPRDRECRCLTFSQARRMRWRTLGRARPRSDRNLTRKHSENMSQVQTRPAQPATATTQETPLLDSVVEQTVSRLDAMSSRYVTALEQPGLRPLKRSFLTAACIANLEKALDDNIMRTFMRLMDTELGFLTD